MRIASLKLELGTLLDLSGQVTKQVRGADDLSEFVSRLWYCRTPKRLFPPKTTGALYFHRPPAGVPAIAGNIRFRLDRQRGDLMLPEQIPWVLPAGSCGVPTWRLFSKLLQREYGISPPYIKGLKVDVVWGLGEPFYVDVASRSTRIWVPTPQGGLTHVVFQNLFNEQCSRYYLARPYTGSIVPLFREGCYVPMLNC